MPRSLRAFSTATSLSLSLLSVEQRKGYEIEGIFEQRTPKAFREQFSQQEYLVHPPIQYLSQNVVWSGSPSEDGVAFPKRKLSELLFAAKAFQLIPLQFAGNWPAHRKPKP